MRYTPDDPAFNTVVNHEIEGSYPDERMIFLDTDNRVREVVYASEFGSGAIQQVRSRLEKSGVLKGIVHVAASVPLGTRDGHGPRYSSVEYLPDGQFYVRQSVIHQSLWVEKTDLIQMTIEATRSVYAREEEGPEEK
jgi:hypothetical protein